MTTQTLYGIPYVSYAKGYGRAKNMKKSVTSCVTAVEQLLNVDMNRLWVLYWKTKRLGDVKNYITAYKIINGFSKSIFAVNTVSLVILLPQIESVESNNETGVFFTHWDIFLVYKLNCFSTW